MDRKERSQEALEVILPIDEYNANHKIATVVAQHGEIFVVEDTFEDVLWTDDTVPESKKDKPYRAWKRVKKLCEGKTNLDHAPKLKEIVHFAFAPFLEEACDLTELLEQAA